MNPALKGIIPAIISPCDERDVFQEDAYAALAEGFYRDKVDGIYVCGFTGDAFNMRLEDRKRAAEIAVAVSRRAKGQVIVHVGSTNTRDSIELAEHAAKAGAQAISCMPPSHRNFAQIQQYYQDVARAAGIPLLVYHLSAFASLSLSVENLVQLLDIPGVVGLKFSDANLFNLKRLLLARPNAVIFNGNDEMLCPGLMYGAVGGIGLTYNMLPRLFVRMFEAAGQRDWERALQLQEAHMPYLDVMLKYGIFSATDVIMRHKGVKGFSFRRPRQVLDEATGNRLLKELEPSLARIERLVG